MEPEKFEITSKRQSDINLRKVSLDEFDVLCTIGTGAFSRVRLVRSKECQLEKAMALKILKKASILKKKQLKHLQEEKKMVDLLIQ